MTECKKKVGRPKKDIHDKVIKVGVDEETAKLFKEVTKISGKTQSDLLREFISASYAKDFEKMIPNDLLFVLDNYSKVCWDFLHTRGCGFEIDNLSDRMPAFILNSKYPLVYVKYPTFKIHIFNRFDSEKPVDISKLKEILPNDIDLVFQKIEGEYLLKSGNLEKINHPYILEIMCVGETIEERIKNKTQVVQVLENSGYTCIVYHSFFYKTEMVEKIVNGKYFRVLTE